MKARQTRARLVSKESSYLNDKVTQRVWLRAVRRAIRNDVPPSYIYMCVYVFSDLFASQGIPSSFLQGGGRPCLNDLRAISIVGLVGRAVEFQLAAGRLGREARSG